MFEQVLNTLNYLEDPFASIREREALLVLRKALSDAQQEAEHWKLVHEWRQLADAHSYSNGFNTEHGYFFNCYVDHKKVLELHEGTRLTALKKAADWCRAELAK